jgi:hypothetical protein
MGYGNNKGRSLDPPLFVPDRLIPGAKTYMENTAVVNKNKVIATRPMIEQKQGAGLPVHG